MPRFTAPSSLAACAQGLMFLSRLKRLVWAAPDLRVGANGSWIDLFSKEHPIHRVEVASGILQDESADLMRSFFQKQRKKHERKDSVSMQEMVEQQRARLLACARRVVPCATSDDILQPNDFPELELHPHFRYEEGFWMGCKPLRPLS